jgi:hypothetical protein
MREPTTAWFRPSILGRKGLLRSIFNGLPKNSDGNDGLMESEENIKPFPSLPTVLGNPAKNAGLPHSHRTTTTTYYDDNLALQKRRRFSFAPT